VDTDKKRDESDPLVDFFETYCDLGDKFSVTFKDLYEAYEAWAAEKSIKPLGKKLLGQILSDRGFRRSRDMVTSARIYTGLRLRMPLKKSIRRHETAQHAMRAGVAMELERDPNSGSLNILESRLTR